MKKICIIMTIFYTLLLMGCVKEHLPSEEGKCKQSNFGIILKLPSAPQTRVNDDHDQFENGTPQEREIKTFDVLFYAIEGGQKKLAAYGYCDVDTPANNVNATYDALTKLIVLNVGTVTANIVYDIVVISNANLGGFDITPYKVIGALKSAMDNAIVKMNANAVATPLLMSGVTSNTFTNATPRAEVTLIRQVAKVQISVKLSNDFILANPDLVFGDEAMANMTTLTSNQLPNYSYITHTSVDFARFDRISTVAPDFTYNKTVNQLTQRVEAGGVSENHKRWTYHGYIFENLVEGKDAAAKAKATNFTLNIPYKDVNGKVTEVNIYRFNITDHLASQAGSPHKTVRNHIYKVNITIVGWGSDGLKAVIDCVPWDVVDIDKPVGQIRVESKYDVCDVYVSNNTDFTLTDLKSNVDIKVTPPEGYQLISPVDGIVYTGTTTPIILRGNAVTLNQSISLKITDVTGAMNIASPISFTPYASTFTAGYNYVDISGAETFHSDNWRDVEFTNGLSSTYSRATAVTDLVANSGVRCHFNGNLTNKTKITAISSVRNGAKVGRIYSQPAGVALLSYQSDADGVYISSVSPINLGVYVNAMAYDVAMTSQKGLELKGNIISQTGFIEGDHPGVVDANNQSNVTLSFKRSESNVADIVSTFFFNRVKFHGLIYIDRNYAANTPQASGYSFTVTGATCPPGYRYMTNAEALSHEQEVKAVNGYVAKTLTQYAPRIAQWTESKSGNVIYWSKTGSASYSGFSQLNWVNRDVVAYCVTLEGIALTIDSRDLEGGTSGSRLAYEIPIRTNAQVVRCLKSPK